RCGVVLGRSAGAPPSWHPGAPGEGRDEQARLGQPVEMMRDQRPFDAGGRDDVITRDRVAGTYHDIEDRSPSRLGECGESGALLVHHSGSVVLDAPRWQV